MVREAVLQVIDDVYDPRIAVMEQTIEGLMLSMKKIEREKKGKELIVRKYLKESITKNYLEIITMKIYFRVLIVK